MKTPSSRRVIELRSMNGWSQEDLASKAGVGLRTVQRIESGKGRPAARSLSALAAAFHIDVELLYAGSRSPTITDLIDDFTCPTCGAELIERTFVEHQYGDAELETFCCGFTRGYLDRPCPKSSEFPKITEYQLSVEQDADGVWWCASTGLTSAAQKVPLLPALGGTPTEAREAVESSYRRLSGERTDGAASD